MKIINKYSFIAVMAFIGSLLSFAESHPVNTGKSSVQWTGSKVGGAHSGDIMIKAGDLSFKDGMLSGGSFVIDMTTINTTDLTGGRKSRLDGHLKNDDFFGVNAHPTATFKISSTKAGSSKDKVAVTGDITIKGVTKEISFEAKVMSKGGKPSKAVADIVFNRSNFDIKYRSGSFFENLGDKLIHDDIKLKVSLAL